MATQQETKKNNSFLCLLFTHRGRDTGLLLLRIFASAMLMRHGIQKIQNFDALSASFADPLGLGARPSLIMIILAEVGCSLLVMLGLLTRPAALAIIFGMFVAAFMSYPGGFDMQSSEMPLLYMGIFTAILLTGAGRYSADDLIGRKLCYSKRDKAV